MKDGVFDAHSNDGKRGPRVEEGKRTGSQGFCRRGRDRLRRGQKRDEAESRLSEDPKPGRTQNTEAGLMEGSAEQKRDSVARAPDGARIAPLSHSSWGNRVFLDHD